MNSSSIRKLFTSHSEFKVVFSASVCLGDSKSSLASSSVFETTFKDKGALGGVESVISSTMITDSSFFLLG